MTIENFIIWKAKLRPIIVNNAILLLIYPVLWAAIVIFNYQSISKLDLIIISSLFSLMLIYRSIFVPILSIEITANNIKLRGISICIINKKINLLKAVFKVHGIGTSQTTTFRITTGMRMFILNEHIHKRSDVISFLRFCESNNIPIKYGNYEYMRYRYIDKYGEDAPEKISERKKK